MQNRTAALLAFAAMGFASISSAAGPPKLSLEDRQAIQELISTYSYTYDAKDIEAFLALFTKDCIWDAYEAGNSTPMARAANRDELRAIVTQRVVMLQQKGIQSRHYQTNTVLAARVDGQVEATTMLNLMRQVTGEEPATVTTGVYKDVIVKTEQGWRFAKRTLLIDQGDLPK